MKKRLLYLLFVFTLSSSLFSSSWDGGGVRMMALGNTSIAMPDSTSVIDLYSDGFASLLCYRDKADVVSLSGAYDQLYTTFFGGYTSGTGITDERGNYILHWFSPEDALMIHPFYLNVFSVLFDGVESRNTGGARIEYSRVIGGGFSAGAMFKYLGAYETSGATVYTSDYLTKHSDTIRDLEWLVDAGFKMDNGLAFAVSGGYTVPQAVAKRAPDMIEYTYATSNFLAFNNYGFSGSGISSGPTGDINYRFESSGVNINAGAQYIKKGEIEASISGGAVFGFNYDYRTASDVFPSMDMYQKGTAYNASLKCRVFPAKDITAGFMAQGSGVDYTSDVLLPATEYFADIAAGASYDAGFIRVPVEIFGHLQDGAWLYKRYAGIRGGAEWEVLPWLTVRAGGSWPGIQEYARDFHHNFIYELTAGLGINMGNLKADIGASHSERSYTQESYGEQDYLNKKTTFGLSLKLVL